MSNSHVDAKQLAEALAKIKALEETQARVAAENAKLRAEVLKPKPMTMKITDKGGVSVYGLNARFPVTLYQEQWLKLCTAGPIVDFIEANKAEIEAKNKAWHSLPEAEQARINAEKAAKFSKTG